LNFDRGGAMTDDERSNDERLEVLRAAIDEGIAAIDAGSGREMTVEELMAEVCGEADLDA
jgi:hypothetical protein